MKYLLIFLLLFSCQLSPDETIEPEIIIEEEIIDEEIIEVWTPEILHIYVLNQVDEIVTEYIADDDLHYPVLLNAVKLNVESHNQDFPLDPWHYIGGGT